MNPVTLQLQATRAALVASIAAIDVILGVELQEPPPSSEPEPREFHPDAARCQHPRTHWFKAPAMGKPDRWLCRCGEEMNEEDSHE